MTRLTIADAAAQVLRERGEDTVWVGKFGLLHDIYERAGRDGSHPLNVHASVMAAVRRSDRFERCGFIRSCYASNRESRHSVFRLVGLDPAAAMDSKAAAAPNIPGTGRESVKTPGI